MNAKEFIKKFGWQKARYHLSKMDAENWHNSFFNDLKQYIDAYELVQKLNGVDNCKYLIKNHQHWFDVDGLTAIKQAITLIEEI